MVATTCFGITLPSSGSVPSAFWEMLNWGAADRILWMGVLCLVTWFVAISDISVGISDYRIWCFNITGNKNTEFCNYMLCTGTEKSMFFIWHEVEYNTIETIPTCLLQKYVQKTKSVEIYRLRKLLVAPLVQSLIVLWREVLLPCKQQLATGPCIVSWIYFKF
jgi:hypothetical protein